MFKKFVALTLSVIMILSLSGCANEKTETQTPSVNDSEKLPEYSQKQFELSGFWAPYELTEESLQTYKDAGFTHLAMINHSLGATSEEQFYLGSNRTMKALEICKKVGLKAILNYNDWMVPRCEEEGADFYGDTPFSKHDIYGEYKDIITGIHICDEPYKKNWNNENHFETYGNKTLIEDFKKVYPNAKYIVNLIPMTAIASRGFDTYEEMMELYEKTFMDPFDNPMVSVDVYPFHQDYTQDDGTLLINYQYIANSAKKYNVKPTFILQSSVGGADEGRKEFEMELSESDLRWEVYNALAYGADSLQYYCYSVPKSFDENGNEVFMYDNCILKRDNTPSDVYYSLQKIHKEIQSFASVILSYDWEQTIGMSGVEDQSFRMSQIELDQQTWDPIRFENCKNFVDATNTHDVIISRFTSEKYGEAYMFHNWADRGDSNTITATFKDCSKLAVYGGVGFDGTPKIVELDKDGKAEIKLEYGEGVFVTPIA